MQGPRNIPPGRRSQHRPPPGFQKGGRPERGPFRARKGRRREWLGQHEEPSRKQPAPPPPTHWVYLHGLASSPASRKAHFFQQKLSSVGLPVVVPDLNVPSFEHLAITAMLGKIDEVIAALPAESRVGIIGSSLGGLVALLAAERHAERVVRLFLMAPVLGLFRSNFVGLGHAGLKKWERDGFVEVHHYGTDSTRRLSYEFVQDARQYDESRLKFGIPITIVHGARDQIVDPHLSAVFAKHHPTAKLHLVEDDHTLVASCTQMWDWLWKEIRPRHPESHEE